MADSPVSPATTTASKIAGQDLWFRDLAYTVAVPKKRWEAAATKDILSGVTGVCRAGRVLAIMGPSGAGKTSLLDLLAGRKLPSSGDFALGKRLNITATQIRKRAAYVQQDDAIMPSQTVREAVTMAALLTLPRDMPQQEKVERAEKTMRTFHLDGCANAIVGDPVGKLKGISGGERKRCAVAMAAIREPQILFLDEPTSGLDTHKAHLLVRVLQNIARTRQSIVVCTIHQPSSDLFALFDDLMLLLDGRTVFNGLAEDAVEHFAAVGFPCPPYANPADYFFMHVLASPDGTVAQGQRRDQLVDAWAESKGQSQVLAAVEAVFEPDSLADSPTKHSEYTTIEPVVGASSWQQFRVLIRRSANDIKRNPMQGRAQLVIALIFGFIIGAIWWQVTNDQNSVQDRSGALFMMCTMSMMRNVMGVLSTFTDERGAVLREQANGMYWTLPYFSARVMVDIPFKFMQPFLFGTIAYLCLGLQRDGGKYVICILVLFLMALAGNAIGLFLACVVSDINIALIIAPMVVLPLMMFSGFVLNPESVPVYLKWVEWISPMKYAFSALVQNEFTGLELVCLPEQYRKVVAKDGTIVEVCPLPSGNAFLERLNIQSVLTIQNCCLLLIALMVFFTLAAYAGLSMITRKSNPTGAGRKRRNSTALSPKSA